MNTKKTDIATIIGKGALGAIPFFGPLMAEVLGAIVPNQRIERIESFLKLLESKISEEDKEKIQKKIAYPGFVDLVEDSLIQVSRALSEKRKEYISALLKNGLTDDELEHIEYKRLLFILGELNDIEVLILKSHTMHGVGSDYREFLETHKNALTPPRAHPGSPQELIDKDAIHQSYRSHLVNLGLLQARFKTPKRGELPEFDDKTGMLKRQSYNSTELGRLLLRSIDQGGEI